MMWIIVIAVIVIVFMCALGLWAAIHSPDPGWDADNHDIKFDGERYYTDES